MTTQEFTYSLIKETSYKGVTFSLYSSTEGWFVETSEGVVTEYMTTKKEALEYVKRAKKLIKIEEK
jgi:hypothetical protein